MAARVLFQRSAAAPVAATLLLGSTMVYPRTAYAEAPGHLAKKPIYDDDLPTATVSATLPTDVPSVTEAATATTTATTTTMASPMTTAATTGTTLIRRRPTPTDRLAAQIRRARLFLYQQASAAEDGVNRAADRVFGLERSLTETLAALAPARESGERLLPGAVYVLVAGMAGSIVTRRRNVLLRATVPAVFALTAGWSLLPVTMRNCADLAWTFEQRVPALADAHLRTRAALTRSADLAQTHAALGRQAASDKVQAVREKVEDWVKQGK